MSANTLTAFFSAARRRLPVDTLWRLTLWLAWSGYALLLVILLLARFVVLPNVDNYRSDIEHALTASLAQNVSIERIEGGWRGLRPRLSLHGFRIRAADGRPALSFDQVDAVLAWSSLLHFDLRLYRLSIIAPSLNLRRDATGRLFVGELELNTKQEGPDFSDWVLSQHQVVIRDATITWQDEMRQAPPLTLSHLNFRLESRGEHHRFGLTAEPPRNMAARLDLRGDFRGDDLDNLAAWQGEAYAELDYADLAVWRQWIDYPLELPAGHGGLRLWLGVGADNLAYATADIALADVELRLHKDLPAFAIERMSGRLTARRSPDGFEVSAKQLALATREGVRVAPTDFRLRWSPRSEGGGNSNSGEFDADGLDLDAVVKLAAYLPLDPELRAKLSAYQPHGRLPQLRLNWSGNGASPGGPAAYRVQARFDNLGLAAQGTVPGFSGMSGRIDGSEQSGSLELSSRNAALQLPAVFAEPRLALSSLDASATWKADSAGVAVNISRATFQNGDASGELHGSYHTRAGSAGDIDLSGRLADADARSVSRYMPLVVGADVREFLKKGLLGGRAEETSLRLKGDLDRFPFADGSGIFLVKGRFHGATLRYATEWPQIDDISGSLLFEGKRMVIEGDKGRIFGAALTGVHCELPDLDSRDPVMTVTGKASGSTGEFLHFIEASPVGSHIDHVTQDISALGTGDLDLKLVLPLQRIVETAVDGGFQFSNNRVWLLPDLPPLTEAAGRLAFTGKSLTLPHARANFLGSPMSLEVKSSDAAGVQAVASGRIDIADLRRQYELPLLDYVSGGAAWRATVSMRNHVPELRIDSGLVGIASSLPPPFNKNTLENLPLHFERKAGKDADHDQIRLSLGRDVNASLLRSRATERMKIDRGLIGIGDWMPLPEHGVLLAAQLPRVDFDFWRRVLPTSGGGSAKGEQSPISALKLRAGEAKAFGHQVTELSLNAARSGDGWGAQINSREVSGSLAWRDQGAGRLVARLKRLAIVSSAGPTGDGAGISDELPGLDVEVEQLQLMGKELGRLKLAADNHDGRWDAKVDVDNPDGNITGSGSWTRSATAPHTHFQFNLGAKSIDRFLSRFGYPDSVRRGTASLEGDVDWNASPLAIDYPSLSGRLKFEAKNGQFAKFEPGAGRLLGVLSLQYLPRRLSLDFRDVLSEGFAFDSIEGAAKVTHGVAETTDLTIDGPAAKVLMSGKVNLVSETADLRVHIQPALSEMTAIGVGAMLANPVAGAVTLLAQKLLKKNPLGDVFSYEYAMTGPWADLKVDKVSARSPTAQGNDSAKSN
jgi:uncharacterized protein (TIGR02099 family)